MASLAVPQADIDALVRIVRTGQLLNKQLIGICNANGLKGGGVKLELQNRIVSYINAHAHDPVQFQRLRQSIQDIQKTRGGLQMMNTHNPTYDFSESQASATVTLSPPSLYSQRTNTSGQYFSNQSVYAAGQRTQIPPSNYCIAIPTEPLGLQFTPSPFYRVISPLGELRTLEDMPNHRNTVELWVKGQDHPLLQQCIWDNSKLKVMLFGAASASGIQDIAFPQNSELKINGGELKVNMRGLKNKPGTTRPVDVTNFLRLKLPAYRNSVSFTYALTLQKYYLSLCICETTSSIELVRRLETRPKISKSFTLDELRKNAEDPEVEATSSKLSLKCPISFKRLETPCRAQNCKHLACFDALSYLLLQEQAAQWKCPICNKIASYDNLAIDMYVKEILDQTSEDQDQVTIEPGGLWHVENEGHDEQDRQLLKAAKLEDDEVISIFEGTPYATPYTPTRSLDTPGFVVSRESSSVPKQQPRSNPPAKRTVIDLTLDSDDDDSPRQPKRILTGIESQSKSSNVSSTSYR